MHITEGWKGENFDLILDAEFKQGRKLFSKCLDMWLDVKDWCEKRFRDPEALRPPLKPLMHYKDYFLAKMPERNVEKIIEKSDREAILAFDILVDEFNLRIEEFNSAKFMEANTYVQKAFAMVMNISSSDKN